MEIYNRFFLGFYALYQKIFPKDDSPGTYAVGLLSGALALLFFSATIFFTGRKSGILETAAIFLVIYGLNYMYFIKGDNYKAMIEKHGLQEREMYLSVLLFCIALASFILITENAAVGG